VVEAGSARIAAHTVLWAAGVEASPLARTLGVPLDRAGRVLVEPDLTVPGHPEVFVVGDLAAFQHQGGTPLPGMAPVAIQMGRHAARNVLQAIQGKTSLPFRYRNKGMMATIGRNAAIAQIGRLRLQGFLAWLTWLIVHIFFLIGFRNRALVLFEWMWMYLTFNRGVRLITGQGDQTARGLASEPPPLVGEAPGGDVLTAAVTKRDQHFGL
jgi:NADH:ubiquinone reductase (H+-translocating)